MSEIHVTIRDLKAQLSEYIRMVEQGQTVIITKHGRPTGRITPVEQPLAMRLKALQEAGMLSWNGKKLEPVEPAAVNRSEKQVSDILVDMRE